jgi:prepilin-type N-terminal cleavage/methylation domain-containing protein
MATCDKKGFTLIEMMVALVVGGLLMASLVALSSSVQKSFGRSKDITELQANMRFTMKLLVDDFSRMAFMSSPDPGTEDCHRHPLGQEPDGDTRSLAFDSGDSIWKLQGNYVSSRDYLISTRPPYKVLCRNGMDPFLSNCVVAGVDELADGSGDSAASQFKPFADGPKFDGVFWEDMLVRFDTGDGRYSYHRVRGANIGDFSLDLSPTLNNDIPGDAWWASPVTSIEYRLEEDADYVIRYAAPEPEAENWVLRRVWSALDDAGDPVENELEVAEFLLPPPDGFSVEVYDTTNITTSTEVDSDDDVDPPADVRALMLTLRARTEVEDPRLNINDLDPAARNYGVDLDGDPGNGLARVRVEQTVVELRNMALNPCLTDH